MRQPVQRSGLFQHAHQAFTRARVRTEGSALPIPLKVHTGRYRNSYPDLPRSPACVERTLFARQWRVFLTRRQMGGRDDGVRESIRSGRRRRLALPCARRTPVGRQRPDGRRRGRQHLGGVIRRDRLKPSGVLVDAELQDGIRLARELAELPWRPRIVLTFIDPDIATADNARRAGAEAFLNEVELANAPLAQLLGDQ